MKRLLSGRPRTLMAMAAALLSASLLYPPAAGATEAGTAEEPSLVAPTGLVATYASGSIRLGFTRWNPATDVIRHEYRTAMTEADLASADWQLLSGRAGTGSVSGLALGQTHYMQVRAVGASGPSGASNTASAAMPVGPATPYQFVAEHDGQTRVYMTWQSPRGGYPSGTYYEWRVEDPRGQVHGRWRTVSANLTWNQNGRTGTVFVVFGMTRNTTLRIQVRAVSDSLAGTPTNLRSVNTTDLQVPQFSAESAGPTSIRLKWYNTFSDSSTAEFYQYRYAADSEDINDAEWATAPSNYQGFERWNATIGGLQHNTRYLFELRPAGGDQVGGSTSTRARTYSLTKPNAPTGLEAHAVADNPNAVRLTWLAPTDRDVPGSEEATIWDYRWKEGDGEWSVHLMLPGGGPSTDTSKEATVTILSEGGRVEGGHNPSQTFKPNTTYSLQLRVYSMFGQGDWSNTATVTTSSVPEPVTSETFKVERIKINGDRSSVAGVKAATKQHHLAGDPCNDITVTVAAGSSDSVILAAADAKSNCHSISGGSRYIDDGGEVHNFRSGRSTYWVIKKQSTTPPTTPTTPPPPVVVTEETFTVEMTVINGDRSSVAGVKAASKQQRNAGNPCDDITVTVAAGSSDSVILAAADAKSSCHIIDTGSRYIDAGGEVHNFQGGKNTYWTIKRQ